jgi:hypothetical protein
MGDSQTLSPITPTPTHQSTIADPEEEIPNFDVYTVVTLTHHRLKYTYDGDHFERSGASFQADLSDYLPITFKSGVIIRANHGERNRRAKTGGVLNARFAVLRFLAAWEKFKRG